MHAASVAAPVVCTSCGLTYDTDKDLKLHIRIEHSLDLSICEKCGKTFKYKKNLNAHFQSSHTSIFFECSQCQFKCQRKYVLKRHIFALHMNREQFGTKNEQRCGKKNFYKCRICQKAYLSEEHFRIHCNQVHSNHSMGGNNSQKRKFECKVCFKKYTRNDNLRRHMRNHSETRSVYECDHCSKNFELKQNLIRHIQMCQRRIERRERAKVKLFKCLVPHCEAELNDQSLMNKHYEKKHNVQLIHEDLRFDSLEKFEEWLLNLQRNTASQFAVSNKWKNSTSTNRRLRCHRSGFEPPETKNRIRFQKLSGSKKLNGYCPAEIIIKEMHDDKTIVVNMQKVHMGHSPSWENKLQFAGLNEQEKEDIVFLDVPSEAISSSIESFSKQYEEIVMTHENTGEVIIDAEMNAGNTDDENVLNFVSKNKNILLFKCKGQVDEVYGVLKEDDIAIIFMDECQRELLIKFGNTVIAYDRTQKTNPNDLVLHGIFVLHEESKGVAVALLLSNRDDCTVLEIFLDSIKKEVGVLKPFTVVTDVQLYFENAFQVVMEGAVVYSWCTWYVFEQWRQNLQKIENKKKRRQIMLTLYKLSQITCPDDFQNNLEDFLSNPDLDLVEFIKFFNKEYAQKSEYWAYCYRKSDDINVNIIIDSFHTYFKGKTAKKKKMNNMYQCLDSIKTYLLTRNNCNKLEREYPQKMEKLKKLQDRHHKAKKYYSEAEVVVLKNEEYPTWSVTSLSNSNKRSEIKQLKYVQENKKADERSICIGSSSTEDNGDNDDEETDNDEDIPEYNYGLTYIVQHHADRPIKSNSLRCSLCKVSFQEYSCTCIDYLLRNNMCKHIHTIAMYCRKILFI